MSRDITMKEQVFASGALTEIPIPPIAGTAYRKPLASDGEIKPGWKYRDIVDSAAFNEVMYRTTSLVNQLEKDGILIWSNKTNYPEGGIAKGPTDGKLYQAVQASGPGTPAGFKDCEEEESEYWAPYGDVAEHNADPDAHYGLFVKRPEFNFIEIQLESSGTATIDASIGNNYSLQPSGAVTLDLQNFMVMKRVVLMIINGGTSVTFPASIKWGTSGSGTPPSLSSDGTDLISITNIGVGQYLATHEASYGEASSISTSYSNIGGTGDRRGLINVVCTGRLAGKDGPALVNGVRTETAIHTGQGATNPADTIIFDFGTNRYVTEVTFYTRKGAWYGVHIEGSTDGVTWSDPMTFTQTLSVPSVVLPFFSQMIAPYRYLRLIAPSGSAAGYTYLCECEFKINAI